MPGAGKTIMTSMVVDELVELQQNDSSIGLAHIYYEIGHCETQTLTAMLSLILKQLLTQLSAIPFELTEKYLASKSSGRRLPLADIVKYIKFACEQFSKIFIVVDALDECENDEYQRDKFLDSLQTLQKRVNVNLFFTSRPIHEISCMFNEYPSIGIRAHDDDVEAFLQSAIAESPTMTARLGSLQKEVIRVIRQAVQGMFLLAKLYLDAISTKRTSKDIKIELEQILAISTCSSNPHRSTYPCVYDYAYKQAVERIQSQSPASRKIAERALSWIVCAKNRQVLNCISIPRLLAIEDNCDDIEDDEIPSIEDILSVCAGLVVLDWETASLKLVHYTTQEYFNREKDHLLPQPDLYLARSCMSYLTSNTVVNALGQTFPSEAQQESITPWQNLMYDVWSADPIYRYAALYGAYHAGDVHFDLKYMSKLLDNKLETITAFYLQLEHHTYEESRTRDLSLLNPMPARIQKFGQIIARGSLPRVSLSFCAYNGLLDVATEILHSVHDCQSDNFLGFSPLYLAVVAQKEAMVELLLREGCYSNKLVADDQQGSWDNLILEVHPLQAAAAGQSCRIVKLLIDAGFVADIDTLIWSAMSFGSEEVLNIFLEVWYASLADDIGTTSMPSVPSTFSSYLDHTTVDRGMIQITPFRYALQSKSQPRLEMISVLISRGMDVNVLDTWGSTALSIALSESRFDLRIVQLLLDSGADPNTSGVEDQTPLHNAILERRSLATVMALLQSKADPNIQDWHGQTPLHLAVDCADISIVKCLLHAGASSQIKDYTYGESPFIRAARYNRQDIVELMLISGDVNIKDTDLDSKGALCFVSIKQNSSYDLTALLLKHGADANQRSARGMTPLLRVASLGNLDMIKLLIQGGADVRVRDPDGKLAAEIAWENGYDEIVDFLDYIMSYTCLSIEFAPSIGPHVTWPYCLNYETSFGRRIRRDCRPLSLFHTYESLSYLDYKAKLKLRQDFQAFVQGDAGADTR